MGHSHSHKRIMDREAPSQMKKKKPKFRHPLPTSANQRTTLQQQQHDESSSSIGRRKLPLQSSSLQEQRHVRVENRANSSPPVAAVPTTRTSTYPQQPPRYQIETGTTTVPAPPPVVVLQQQQQQPQAPEATRTAVFSHHHSGGAAASSSPSFFVVPAPAQQLQEPGARLIVQQQPVSVAQGSQQILHSHQQLQSQQQQLQQLQFIQQQQQLLEQQAAQQLQQKQLTVLQQQEQLQQQVPLSLPPGVERRPSSPSSPNTTGAVVMASGEGRMSCRQRWGTVDNVPPQALPYGYEVSNVDVVCGRGKASYERPGNRVFLDLVEQNVDLYRASGSKRHKATVLGKIVRTIRASGGKFIKLERDEEKKQDGDKNSENEKDGQKVGVKGDTEEQPLYANEKPLTVKKRRYLEDGDGTWWEIGDATAHEKAGQAMRVAVRNRTGAEQATTQRRIEARKKKAAEEQLRAAFKEAARERDEQAEEPSQQLEEEDKDEEKGDEEEQQQQEEDELSDLNHNSTGAAQEQQAENFYEQEEREEDDQIDENREDSRGEDGEDHDDDRTVEDDEEEGPSYQEHQDKKQRSRIPASEHALELQAKRGGFEGTTISTAASTQPPHSVPKQSARQVSAPRAHRVSNVAFMSANQTAAPSSTTSRRSAVSTTHGQLVAPAPTNTPSTSTGDSQKRLETSLAADAAQKRLEESLAADAAQKRLKETLAASCLTQKALASSSSAPPLLLSSSIGRLWLVVEKHWDPATMSTGAGILWMGRTVRFDHQQPPPQQQAPPTQA